jgi:peptidoglycan DL-endopeptidase CwlO
MVHPALRTRLGWVLAVAALALAFVATPAHAAPGDPTAPDEGSGNMTLGEALDQANAAWLQASAALDASKKRQADLTAQIAQTQARLAPVEAAVNSIAATAYRTGGTLRTMSALLDSDSPDTFMNRTMLIEQVTTFNDHQLHVLNTLQKQLDAQKKAVDAEVATQQAQSDIMAKKKADTEKALAAAGGKATGGFVSVTSPLASPAPRAADGSWPKESCIIDDPTTTGCITPRMLHAMQEAQKAGFTHFVSCFRPSGPYEHPKGRACDFSAQQKGFGGVAAGADKVYGSNLAAFFVRNADAIAVLYVIWFRQVWTPSVGWHSYSGVTGDPSGDHTNHVHLSVI